MEAIDLRWRKSSYSDNGGECVEVAGQAARVLVRDTQDRGGPVLGFAPIAWRRFADQVKRSLALHPASKGPADISLSRSIRPTFRALQNNLSRGGSGSTPVL